MVATRRFRASRCDTCRSSRSSPAKRRAARTVEKCLILNQSNSTSRIPNPDIPQAQNMLV